MPNNKTIANFEFLGYRLIDIKLSCPKKRLIDAIVLKSTNFNLDDKGVLTFHINCELQGEDDLNALSVFECAYTVDRWFETNVEDEGFKNLINNMSFIVLPYIRSALMSLTNDSMRCIEIPLLDLNKIDFVGGTKLERSK